MHTARSSSDNALLFATLILGGALGIICFPGVHLALANAVFPSDVWGKRSGVIMGECLLYAAGLCGLAAYQVWLLRQGVSLRIKSAALGRAMWYDFRQASGMLFRATSWADGGLWLFVILLCGVACRMYFLAEPMHYDETITFHNYVRPGFAVSFYYFQPNNHVLHTLLVQLSTWLFGNTPVAIRLPAFLISVCCILLMFQTCRLLLGRQYGMVGATIMAIVPFVVLYGTMARGYSLVVLLTLGCIMTAFQLLRRPTSSIAVWFGVLCALGFLTMPTFLFVVAGSYVWLFLAGCFFQDQSFRRTMVRMLFLSGFATSVATILVYTPVILATNGITPIIANRFIIGLPYHDFLQRLPGHLYEMIQVLTRGIPTPVSLLAGGIMLTALLMLVALRQWQLAVLLPAMLIGASLILLAKHVIPFMRTWIFWFPVCGIVIDAGWGMLTANFSNTWQARLNTLLALGTAVSAILLMTHDVIPAFPDTGRLTDVPAVARFLETEMDAGDQVSVSFPIDVCLWFYLDAAGIQHTPAAETTGRSRHFYVTQNDVYAITDLTDKPVERLFQLGNTTVYAGVEVSDSRE